MTGLSTKSCANVNWQNDNVAPAFCIDPDDRISQYLLFKVANYAVGAYEKIEEVCVQGDRPFQIKTVEERSEA